MPTTAAASTSWESCCLRRGRRIRLSSNVTRSPSSEESSMCVLPDRERLSVEPGFGDDNDVHPIGSIQLLASFNLSDGTVQSGVTRYPRLGSRVYSAHPTLVHWLVQDSKGRKASSDGISFRFASLPDADGAVVGLSPEQLFGRHCAILGATGGREKLECSTTDRRVRVVSVKSNSARCHWRVSYARR